MQIAHFNDDALELFVLQRLRPAEFRKMESHLLICETCRIAVQQVEEDTKLLTAVLKTIDLEGRKLRGKRKDRNSPFLV